MHADRSNRTLLTLLGLLLIAAGAAGIVAGTNIFGHHYGNRTLLANPGAAYIGTHSRWFWPITAVVALLLAALALRWLITVLRPEHRTGTIEIDTPPGTSLDSAALRDALNTEISGYRGVETSRVLVLGTPDAPRLAVTIAATQDVDLSALRQRLEAQALTHARQALDHPDLPIRLDLTVTNHTGSRVT